MSVTILKRLSGKTSDTAGNSNRFRVAVFGQAGVGKTAFNVRFVTKRFIGEYDPTLENIYEKKLIVPPNHSVLFEIMDTPGQEENPDAMREKIRWADAFILFYSIDDQTSFREINRIKFLITHVTSNNSSKMDVQLPVVIVGNKRDLELDRMISYEEGRRLAAHLNCKFYEVSVRESTEDVFQVFKDLYKLYKSSKVISTRKFNSSLSGQVHWELPGISQYLPILPSKLKTKSLKHINKIPRIQSSPVVHRFQNPYYADFNKSLAETVVPNEDAIPKTQNNTFVNDFHPSVNQHNKSKKANIATIISSNDTPIFNKKSNESESEEATEKGDFDKSDFFAKQAAEEFMKKIVILSLN